MTDLEIENTRLRQENERLWRENTALRPLVSDLQHRLAVAIAHLKASASTADTDVILKTKADDHG